MPGSGKWKQVRVSRMRKVRAEVVRRAQDLAWLSASIPCTSVPVPGQGCKRKGCQAKCRLNARCSMSRFYERGKFQLISWLMEKAAEFLLRGALQSPVRAIVL